MYNEVAWTAGGDTNYLIIPNTRLAPVALIATCPNFKTQIHLQAMYTLPIPFTHPPYELIGLDKARQQSLHATVVVWSVNLDNKAVCGGDQGNAFRL